MSDAAVASIMTGAVTIALSFVGFLTLWVKLKYSADKAASAASAATLAVSAAEMAVEKADTHARSIEEKIEHNTGLTEQAKFAAEAVGAHTEACSTEVERLSRITDEHHSRISAVESQVATMKLSLDNVSKNLDSTRHEMRGHLQTIMNKLDLAALGKAPGPSSEGVRRD